MGAAETFFFDNPFWLWIALGGVLLISEMMTGSGWLLWPAGAAAATGFATLIGRLGEGPQIVFFVVTAVIATFVGRRFIRPAPKATGDINDPTPRLVGQQGEVAQAFTAGQGRVFVDGKEWAAELDGGGDLAARAKVRVVEILGGARLKVTAA